MLGRWSDSVAPVVINSGQKSADARSFWRPAGACAQGLIGFVSADPRSPRMGAHAEKAAKTRHFPNFRMIRKIDP